MTFHDPWDEDDLLGVGWVMHAPRGLTPKLGRPHRLQEGTVRRLSAAADDIAQQAIEATRGVMEEVFTEGTSMETDGYVRAVESLDYKVSSTRAGVEVQFTMGGAPHAVYMTSLAGGPSEGHPITAVNARALRFYWKNPPLGDPPGIYYRYRVMWRPRKRKMGTDPIDETLGRYTQAFIGSMLEAHSRGWVEFMQERVTYSGRQQGRVSKAG